MADAKSMADTIAGYFNSASDEKPEPATCPHCGQAVSGSDEPMSKQINKALGVGDEKSVF